MAIDKKKLASLAGKKKGAKPNAASRFAKASSKKAKFDAEDEEEESSKKAPPKKGGAAAKFAKGGEEEEAEVPEEGEEEEAAEEDPEAGDGEDFGADEGSEEGLEDEMGEGNFPVRPGNPGALIPYLEQYKDDVPNCLDEVDYDLLADPDLEMGEDDAIIMQEGALMLPPRLQANLHNLAGIDHDAAKTIAIHLKNEGKCQDDVQLAGWLYRIGELLDAGVFDEEEEEPVDEEGSEDEEFAEEEEAPEEDEDTGPPM